MHEFMDKDMLEECLIHSLSMEELTNEQVISNLALVEKVLNLDESEEAMVGKEKSQTPDMLVLEELPPHLHYAFLGKSNTNL